MRARTSVRRSSSPRSIRGCSRDGACAPATGSGARRCSRKCCLAWRSRWDTSAGGWSTTWRPTTARAGPRITRSSASTFPSIHGCPTAAAECLRASTTSRRQPSTRLNDNYQTLATNLGEWTQVANSFNLNVTARMRNGLMLQGGFNTGRVGQRLLRRAGAPFRSGRCILAQSPTNPWCDTSSGWVTRATALGSYTIPKVDVQVAGTLRSDQGAPAGRELDRAELRNRRPRTGRLPASAARRSP